MKLQSYEIADALESRRIEAAVRLLLDHFFLSQPDALPDITFMPKVESPRVLI